MKERSPLSLLIRGFVLVALIDLAVIAIVAMLGWWSGWIYLEDFQRAINLAGILVIAGGFVGLLVKMLRSHSRAEGEDQAKPVGEDADQIQTTDQIWLSKYAFTLIFFIAGVVCLVIGILLI
jgi:zinc transporter ZupT